jgi:maleylacetoacetate isomerase
MLKLYDYFRSSAAFRVRIALNLKQLNYEAIPIHLVNNGGEQFSTTYRAINPQSLVPALDDHGQIITQSLAIIEYLDEIHPTPALLPSDPLLKAKVRAFALTIAADIHPINNLRITKYLEHNFRLSETQKLDWYHHWMTLGFTALEKQLATEAVHSFCFGEAPTLADVTLVPQMFNARRFNLDLSAFPTLVRIDEHCQQLSAFSHARPTETVN